MPSVVPATAQHWLREPFRMGSAEQFAELREVFRALDYVEPEVCKRLEIATIHHAVRVLGPRRQAGAEPGDPQALLIRLFLETQPVPWRTVRALLTPGDLSAIEALGLLAPPDVTGDNCMATVALYPTEGLFVASDHGSAGPISDWGAPPDIVFPAIGHATQRFAGLMPRTRCEAFLDLCSGTGIAALIAASRFADRAWAVDITERSTRFARFNAALNAIDNLTALEGDLYEPVAGMTFDRIVANPPYVPAFEDEYIFRDGGQDGERVTWSILGGLAEYLRPGGYFFCDCQATDREGAPLEERLRRALGDAASEFDILVAQATTLDPTLHYARLAAEGEETFEAVGRRHELFKRMGIKQFVFAPILIRRRAGAGRSAVAVRRQLSPHTSARDLMNALDWQAATATWDAAATRRLLWARPRANPRAEIRSVHVQEEGRWVVDRCFLSTAVPFVADVACPPGYATLFMACDGRRTGRQLLQHLKETRLVADDAPEAEFAEMLRHLIEQGLLEIDGIPDAPGEAVRV